MRLEERPAAEWGKRRFRYSCPSCGAHGSREATAERALQYARRAKDPGRKYTRASVTCEYYKRHSFKDRVIKCESVFADGVVTSSTFADKKTIMVHMQKYCRGRPDECPLKQLCSAKYEK